MKKQTGFTLIELLVVIGIIGLLASIALVAFNSSRAKARDSRRKADFAQLNKALEEFFYQYNRMPVNNECGSPVAHFCAGVGDMGASSNDGTNAYETSMQELVTAGFISRVPEPPSGSTIQYTYYNYGVGAMGYSCTTSQSNNVPMGALLVTTLETSQPSLTGDPPSCRPWDGCNWCRDDVASNQFCMCNAQ